LEVDYDYAAIARTISRQKIETRPPNIWRYRELLPIEGEPAVGFHTGMTPFFQADRLAKVLGVAKLYIKDDSVCHPTLSFKDRVVSVALSRAKELGFDTAACASTGNLANAVAALAAQANMKRVIFIPADLEMGKIVASLIYAPKLVAVEGNYDDVNRLCAEVAARTHWAFVNINIRPYYAEGSKTYGFEIAEQMGWKAPQHIVVPAASGSLLVKIWKGLKELHQLGLIAEPKTRLYAAQAEGCCPIVTAIREGSDIIKPVKPKTIAKSLAIGNPADGYYAADAIRQTGGWAVAVSDEEIVEGMRLLGETQGLFTETAGGVTVAAARRLIEEKRIPRDESLVLCITGQGLKTQEAVLNHLGKPIRIHPTLESFEAHVEKLSVG
jgi:threonine synthase